MRSKIGAGVNLEPLYDTPESYPYSTFGGYARKSQRLGWLAHDEHHRIGIGRDAMRNGGNEIERSGSPAKTKGH